ncbi:hypothetical protein BKA93DRAFT_410636 [Sparassis latifolia]
MPASEIDEIFASKGKSSAPKPSSSAPSTDTPPKKTKKSGKRKREAKGETEVRDESESKKSTKRRVPETVLDPSARIAAPATSNKSTKLQNIASGSAAKKKSKKAKEVEDRFKDSRGTGSSMSSLLTLYLFGIHSIQDAQRRKDSRYTRRASSGSQNRVEIRRCVRLIASVAFNYSVAFCPLKSPSTRIPFSFS